MSAGYCWPNAIRIGTLPREQWATEIAKLPETCERSDCNPPGCREKIAGYMRVQYRLKERGKR